jgi:putative cardiolipin synthase
LQALLTDEDALSWAQAKVVYDSPEKRKVRRGERLGRLLYPAIAERIAQTDSSLRVVTPFLVPTPEESRLLSQQVARNVQVLILTNSLMSSPDVAAQAGYARQRLSLLKAGVQLYEVRANLGSAKGSGGKLASFGNFTLHAKLLVFDRDGIFIGSMNLAQRSARLNTEMGLIIDSDHLADTLTARFNALTSLENAYQVLLDAAPQPRLIWRTKEKGEVVEYRTEPARSAWQRFKFKFFSLLPLEREL